MLELLFLRAVRRGTENGRGNTGDLENVDKFICPNEKSLTGVIIGNTLLGVNNTILV